jgi:Right handed beta helix region
MRDAPMRPRRAAWLQGRRRDLVVAASAVLVLLSLVVVTMAKPARETRPAAAPTSTASASTSTTVTTTTVTTTSTTRSTGAAAGHSGTDTTGTECRARSLQTINVGSAGQLQQALTRVRPGQCIRLADGVYDGEFVVRRSGRPGQRIALWGSRAALLRGFGVDRGYVLHLDGARYWTLSGFSVSDGQKGIMADRASFNVLQDLAVHHVGQEAIHLRSFSTDNVVRRSEVRDTGLRTPRFGEGIYVGSAHRNWCRYSGCKPDQSDRNSILDNRIGPNVTAESIDLKEGTSAGLVQGNAFFGANMTSADSWVDVKGNDYLIQGNHGDQSSQDGFQVHVEAPGWGERNLFAENVAELGTGGEYGVRVDKDAAGNVVRCDNRASGASKGLSNIPCR